MRWPPSRLISVAIFPETPDALDVIRCVSDLHCVRVAFGFLVNRVNPFERPAEPTIGREILRLNINTKKHRAYVAALQPRYIGLVVSMFLGELIAFIDNVAWRIDMTIQNQQVAHQRFEPLLRPLLGGQEYAVHAAPRPSAAPARTFR